MLNDQADTGARLNRCRRRGCRYERYEGIRHVVIGPGQWIAARIRGLAARWDVRVLPHPERLKAARFAGACQFIRPRTVFHIVTENAKMHETRLSAGGRILAPHWKRPIAQVYKTSQFPFCRGR